MPFRLTEQTLSVMIASALRDFTFDEDAVLGKFSEEELLHKELIRTAANQVLRRLQALLSASR